MEIKVANTELHEAFKAFKLLFKREPEIMTCRDFDDVDGVTCFASVPVVAIHKTKVTFECDDANYKAYIKDIKYFWFK